MREYLGHKQKTQYHSYSWLTTACTVCSLTQSHILFNFVLALVWSQLIPGKTKQSSCVVLCSSSTCSMSPWKSHRFNNWQSNNTEHGARKGQRCRFCCTRATGMITYSWTSFHLVPMRWRRHSYEACLLIHRTRKQMGVEERNQWGETLRSILWLHYWLPFSPPTHTHSLHTTPNSFSVTETKDITACTESYAFLTAVISSILRWQ